MQSGPSNFAFLISLKSLKLFSFATCPISKLTFNLTITIVAFQVVFLPPELTLLNPFSTWMQIVVVEELSCVPFFATPWTVSRQAAWSMGFPRHEYWSGLPFPNTGVGCHFLLQGIFLAQVLYHWATREIHMDANTTLWNENLTRLCSCLNLL